SVHHVPTYYPTRRSSDLSGQQSTGAPVAYSFQVIAPNTTTSVLALGTTAQGTLAQPGASATFTFNGQVGQRLLYDPLQNNVATRSEEHTSELQSRSDLVC